jgi:hypothetical protein
MEPFGGGLHHLDGDQFFFWIDPEEGSQCTGPRMQFKGVRP